MNNFKIGWGLKIPSPRGRTGSNPVPGTGLTRHVRRFLAKATAATLPLCIVLVAACSPCRDGCETSMDVRTGQAQAIAIARDLYGLQGPDPRVVWVDVGDCSWGRQFTAGKGADAHCVWGTTASPDEVWVVANDWRTLVHELLHVHLWRSRCDPDADHKRPEWETVEIDAENAVRPRR